MTGYQNCGSGLSVTDKAHVGGHEARPPEPIDARPVPVVAAASASGGMTRSQCSTAGTPTASPFFLPKQVELRRCGAPRSYADGSASDWERRWSANAVTSG